MILARLSLQQDLRVCALCSAAYALRSYLYLLVHTVIAGPAALWLGTGSGVTLYQMRVRVNALS